MTLLHWTNIFRPLNLGCALAFATALISLAPTGAKAQANVPILTNHVDVGLGSAGVVSPTGMDYLAGADLFFVLDGSEIGIDHFNVFIVDASGNTLLEISAELPGGECPSGIVFEPTLTQLAIVDRCSDQLFLTDLAGLTVSQCSTLDFGSTNGTGIALSTTPGQLAVVDSSVGAVLYADTNCVFQGGFPIPYSTAPSGIALLASGTYAIVDSLSDAVVVADSTTGQPLGVFDTGFISTNPQGIAPGIGAAFPVLEANAHEIFLIDPSGTVQSEAGCAAFGCQNPTGIDYSAAGDLLAIVDDLTDSIYFVTPGIVLAAECSIASFSSRPQGVAFDPTSGNLAVVDNTADKLFIVSFDGTNCAMEQAFDLTTFGIGFFSPVGIAHVGGTLFAVLDSVDQAVALVDLAAWGKSVVRFGTVAAGLSGPSGLQFTGGSLIISDSSADDLVRVSLLGGVEGKLDLAALAIDVATGVAFDSNAGRYIVVDARDDVISTLNLPAWTP